MADEIQRTPEQLATLEARRVVKERVAQLDNDIAELQAGIDDFNTTALTARDEALKLTHRRDAALAERNALLSPLATQPTDGGDVVASS